MHLGVGMGVGVEKKEEGRKEGREGVMGVYECLREFNGVHPSHISSR